MCPAAGNFTKNRRNQTRKGKRGGLGRWGRGRGGTIDGLAIKPGEIWRESVSETDFCEKSKRSLDCWGKDNRGTASEITSGEVSVSSAPRSSLIKDRPEPERARNRETGGGRREM